MRLTAAAAAVTGFTMVFVYIALVVNEGDNSSADIVPWAVAMTIPALLAVASLAVPPRTSRWLLGCAALLFLPFIVSALAPGFLICAGLAAAGAVQANARATPTLNP